MTKKLNELKREFSEKSEILDNAKLTLKREFIGIDNIIDEVIENVRSWYILSDIQEKPAVLNLWGLTGTGKTSLVLRLMELIGYEDKTFRFDLGEKDGNRSFQNALTDLCENPDDSPIAIILDELQHSRTIKGPFREEIENDKNRMIWELIDSGKVSYIEWKMGLWSVERMSKRLNDLINAGVVVSNGVVVLQKELFMNEMGIELDEETNEPLLFVQEHEYKSILSLAGDYFGFKLKADIQNHLLSLDGPETINFLFKVIQKAARPSIKSFTKAIIFILGNIDEAYTMSGNLTADISADEFHEMSLKIKVPDIKRALRARFRDEQIARLGNIHIIYPALNSYSYREIIKLELKKISERIFNMLHLHVEFDDSIIDEIYKEGVYPTQGARPLFTTIHQMVKSKLSIYLSEILKKNLTVDRLVVSSMDQVLRCQFFKSQTLKHEYSTPINYNLDNLRQAKKNEEQAIAAVHEAGHAVLSIALLKIVPEVVVSVTSDSEAMGFMFSKDKKAYISRKDLVPKTAMLLGGIVAEEIIFGEENLTSGGSQDIKMATEALMALYKDHGFGTIPISHSSNQQEDRIYHQVEDVEQEVRSIIEQSRLLAKEELVKQKTLLLEMADILSEKPRIEKEEIMELIKVHSNICLENSRDFYRRTLKHQVMTKSVLAETLDSNPLVLNKEK